MTLGELSKRLAQEVNDLPDHDAVTDVFDYLAGAIFCLKKCEALPFWERKSGRLKNYKRKVSEYLSGIPDGVQPNEYWVSGCFVNSAMLRIAACYDRIPKLILKKSKGEAHSLMESLWGKGNESSYANWKAVYVEVNSLKHDASGLASGRKVSRDTVVDALKEIASILEVKKEDIVKAYRK
jgi:hypothetical protein